MIARCVKPKRRAVRTSVPTEFRESKDAVLWQCRSANERLVRSGDESSWFDATRLDVLDERLLEEVKMLERESGAESDTVQ